MIFSNILNNLFGSRRQQTLTLNVVGSTKGDNNYVDLVKGDRIKLRQIYHNTNKNYALAGQLVKPIINNNVNFIGIPTLFGNKKVLKVIDEIKIDYRKIHKSIEIDGTVFVWPQWDQKEEKIKLIQIPINVVNEIFIDPITKEITGYRLKEHVVYNALNEANKQVDIEYVITADISILSVIGDMTKKVVTKNPFGIVPIIRFSNDRDDDEMYGHSEFESIAPQLRFYHELTYEAGAAQSRDGHPKLKVTTKNVKQWIDNNFGAGTYGDIAAGNGTISMEDRDLFINAEGEDVSYLYLNKTSGDYNRLSETTFTNIVEGSETPEINFGANFGTSLASVKEYRPVWIKKIEAKQYEREQSWLKVYEIILVIHNFVHFKNLKSDIEMQWPRPNFASIKEQSDIIKSFATAIQVLRTQGAVTKEEVYNTLKKLDIFELISSFKEHEEIIIDEQDAEMANNLEEKTIDKTGNKKNKDNNKTSQE